MCSPLVHCRETARHENGRDAGDSSRLAPDTSWQLWRKHKSRGSAVLGSWSASARANCHHHQHSPHQRAGYCTPPSASGSALVMALFKHYSTAFGDRLIYQVDTTLRRGGYERCKSTRGWSKLVAIDSSSNIRSLTSIKKHCAKESWAKHLCLCS